MAASKFSSAAKCCPRSRCLDRNGCHQDRLRNLVCPLLLPARAATHAGANPRRHPGAGAADRRLAAQNHRRSGMTRKQLQSTAGAAELISGIHRLITDAKAGLAASVSASARKYSRGNEPNTVNRLSYHWRGNWKSSTGAALAPKTCAISAVDRSILGQTPSVEIVSMLSRQLARSAGACVRCGYLRPTTQRKLGNTSRQLMSESLPMMLKEAAKIIDAGHTPQH